MESPEDFALVNPTQGPAPFTPGADLRSYDEQPWTIEILLGAADPAFTSQLVLEAIEAGADRVALRLDSTVDELPGPDGHQSRASAGESGMVVCRAADFARLFESVDPGRLFLLADQLAAPIAACFVAAARSVGREWRSFGISNDPLGEAFSSGAANPEAWALRACRDLALWLAAEAPQATRQTLGAGAEHSTAAAAPEVAAVLAHAAEYRRMGFGETLRARFACGHRVLDEAAKFRAAREAHWRRFGGGASLQIEAVSRMESLGAPQADVNLVRISLQAMAAALGGARTICLLPCQMDRASVRLAVRTQQLLAAETGVTRVADPAAGSEAIERKTARFAGEALELAVQDLPSAWQALRSRGADRHQPVVGVTMFTTPNASPQTAPRAPSAWFEALARDREQRDQMALDDTLLRLRNAARGTGNLMPALIEAAECHATLGEMFISLRDCQK